MTATTASTFSFGTYERGQVSDRTIITSLLDLLDTSYGGYYSIKRLSIVRRPPEVNDYDVMVQTGFTAIKADIEVV